MGRCGTHRIRRFACRGTRSATVSRPPSPKVEVEELKPGRAAGKREIRAVAPAVPMKLIKPFRSDMDAAPAGDCATWGVQAVAADTSPFTGQGIVVAILDTGIDASHPAFAGVDIVRRNFITESDDDEHGHGTHCAGTVFGRSVEGVRIGVAPGITEALIGKVLGEEAGESDQIAEAILSAVNSGAQVISMSLGIDFPGYVRVLDAEGFPTELATSIALEGYRANILLFERFASYIAAQSAFMRTTLLVAAARNESRRDERPDFQIAVSPPAVADGLSPSQPSLRPRKATLSRLSRTSVPECRDRVWPSIPLDLAAGSSR